MRDWTDEDERRWAASPSPIAHKTAFLLGVWTVRVVFAVLVALILWIGFR